MQSVASGAGLARFRSWLHHFPGGGPLLSASQAFSQLLPLPLSPQLQQPSLEGQSIGATFRPRPFAHAALAPKQLECKQIHPLLLLQFYDT